MSRVGYFTKDICTLEIYGFVSVEKKVQVRLEKFALVYNRASYPKLILVWLVIEITFVLFKLIDMMSLSLSKYKEEKFKKKLFTDCDENLSEKACFYLLQNLCAIGLFYRVH